MAAFVRSVSSEKIESSNICSTPSVRVEGDSSGSSAVTRPRERADTSSCQSGKIGGSSGHGLYGSPGSHGYNAAFVFSVSSGKIDSSNICFTPFPLGIKEWIRQRTRRVGLERSPRHV
jgi:hypothetical protein